MDAHGLQGWSAVATTGHLAAGHGAVAPPLAPPPRPRPAARRCRHWLGCSRATRSGLDDAALRLLDQSRAACAPAAVAYPLLQEIARTITEQTPARLDTWLVAASECGLPDVATFAAGLRRERAASLAALTLPWGTGPVQGKSTRLRLIKRQSYGPSGLDPRKRRFLLAVRCNSRSRGGRRSGRRQGGFAGGFLTPVR